MNDLNLIGFDLDNNYLDIIINNYKHSEKSYPKEIMQNIWVGTYSKYQEPITYIWLQLNNHNYSNNSFNYVLSALSCDILNFLIGIHLYKAFDIGYKGIEASDAILPVVGIEIFLIDPALENLPEE